MVSSVGTQKPTMKEVNRYVKSQHAVFWNDIAYELDLEYDTIDGIEKNVNDCEKSLCEVVNVWLKSNNNPTWKVLEIAIINAKRLKDGLDLIEDLVGKEVYIKLINSLKLISSNIQ